MGRMQVCRNVTAQEKYRARKMYEEKPKSFRNITIDISQPFDVPQTNYFEIDKLKLEEYYICYFDILGYQNQMQILGEKNFLEIIYALMDTLIDQVEDINYHIYSDNITFFVKKTNDNICNVRTIGNMISLCFLLQRNFMGQYRMLIRGCITQGKLFYNGNFIYGSGLIKAYKMENNEAIYPRILVDKECIDLLINGNDYVTAVTYDQIMQYLVEDDDGEIFIGYVNMPDGPSLISIEYLLYHKALIENWLKLDLSDRIKGKYLWCKKYHNLVCNIYGLDDMHIR